MCRRWSSRRVRCCRRRPRASRRVSSVGSMTCASPTPARSLDERRGVWKIEGAASFRSVVGGEVPSNLDRDPNGVRTRVTGVKGRCPRPLDDGAVKSKSTRPQRDSNPCYRRERPVSWASGRWGLLSLSLCEPRRIRTFDPRLKRPVLYRLSYGPGARHSGVLRRGKQGTPQMISKMVGLGCSASS